MNQYVKNSKLLHDKFIIKIFEVSYSDQVSELGKISSRKLIVFFRTLIKLIYVLVFFNPALIYFQISTTGFALYRDICFAFIIKLFRKKIIYHLHGKGLELFANKNMFNRIILRAAFKNEETICLSNLVKNDIVNVVDCNPYIVPNGVTRIDCRFIIEKNVVNNKPVILYYSNFSRVKGLKIFLDAIEILNNEKINFTACIAGRESDYKIKDIEKIISEKKLNNLIKLITDAGGDNKYKLYSEADIFVFPTQYEAFGLVILEAMQFSLPVIASEEGSIPLIVSENETGFLFNKEKPEDLANKIKILIEDSELRKSLGINGRKKYESEFTYEIFEKNISEVFNQVLSVNKN
ncbi:MAG TPA: glycosyltransferase family 4 protein [Melioribacteraceae bacterium]|nr:glycosyltransferase family 4 protein [Melioribacteraceae bacterium]